MLRGYRMISVGKITALTQVRMRADLTTFFVPLRRIQELVERAAVPWTRPPRNSFRLSGTPERRSYKTGALCCRAAATSPLQPLRVLACRERYRLLGPDPCLVTTTVLRCPLAVSVARRFLTSLSAWRWVENEPKCSSPMRTDQPSLVGSTRKIVVIACLVANERSTNRRRSASCGLGRASTQRKLLASALRRRRRFSRRCRSGPFVCEHGNRAGGQQLWPHSALANRTHHRAEPSQHPPPPDWCTFFWSCSIRWQPRALCANAACLDGCSPGDDISASASLTS